MAETRGQATFCAGIVRDGPLLAAGLVAAAGALLAGLAQAKPWQPLGTLLALAGVAVLVLLAWRQRASYRALSRRAARLQEMAEASNDWTWEMDRHLRFTAFSERFEQAFGMSAAQLIGQPRETLMAAENDPELIAQHRADLLARRPFRDFTYRSRGADGRDIWVRLSGVPVFDRQGRFAGYRGVASDVTAQHKAEAAARNAQQRLIDLTDSVPGAVYQARYDGQTLTMELVSAGISSLYGIDQAEAYDPANLMARVHPDDVPRLEREVERAYRESDGIFVEFRIVVDGETKWVRCQAAARPLGDGSVLWNGLKTDITELKLTEDKLRQQQDRYERAVRGSQDGVWDYELGTDTLYFSPRCYELLRLDPERPRTDGAAFFDLVDPRDLDQLRQTIADNVKHGTPYDIEVRMLTGDGGVRWFRLRAETERDAAGYATRIAGTMSDIDQLKRQEAELIAAREKAELANKSKTEFLATMSHELRTPLNAVIGFAEVLEGELLGPLGNARYRAYATDIRESGQHLLSLINDILDHAKIEAGRRELHEEWLSLDEVVEATLRLVRERAGERDVTLAQDLQDALPRVFADQRGLKQILINLLTNAIKFTPAGGRVTVRTGCSQEGVRLEVADTGVGIDPKDVPKALSPFGQADNWLTREHEGTGLGLALCRQLAELHGGRLDLDSEPGTGTTVRVHLPAERLAYLPDDADTGPSTAPLSAVGG